MTASSIHHRPAPYIAAAVAVVAIGAGSLAVSLSRHDSPPAAPDRQAQTAVHQDAPRAQHVLPTTSGGRVMVGE
jgi:hypothetical protein